MRHHAEPGGAGLHLLVPQRQASPGLRPQAEGHRVRARQCRHDRGQSCHIRGQEGGLRQLHVQSQQPGLSQRHTTRP